MRNTHDFHALAWRIKNWGRELGFQQLGISHGHLEKDEAHLLRWLADGQHGDMDWMERHGVKRSRPAELLPGTIAVISARMDYLPPDARDAQEVLDRPERAYISRYALGRDYHKVLRARLQKLCDRITREVGDFGYRCFTDSAPVLEKALARDANLGWIGKHSNLIHPQAGSWFFLGEVYTNLPLPADPADNPDHCGNCTACIDVCPTQAIIGERQVDARRCISYLTIEYKGSIPHEYRKAIGNRIYGCDDCQLVCPWNRFARPSDEPDFRVRHDLDDPDLISLFLWTKEEFLRNTEGSAIRRIGHARWQRNLALALGNIPRGSAYAKDAAQALRERLPHADPITQEQIRWSLAEHGE